MGLPEGLPDTLRVSNCVDCGILLVRYDDRKGVPAGVRFAHRRLGPSGRPYCGPCLTSCQEIIAAKRRMGVGVDLDDLPRSQRRARRRSRK